MAQAALIRVDTQSGLLNYVAYQCHFFLHKDALDDPEKKEKKLAKKKLLFVIALIAAMVFLSCSSHGAHTHHMLGQLSMLFLHSDASLALCNYVFK